MFIIFIFSIWIANSAHCACSEVLQASSFFSQLPHVHFKLDFTNFCLVCCKEGPKTRIHHFLKEASLFPGWQYCNSFSSVVDAKCYVVVDAHVTMRRYNNDAKTRQCAKTRQDAKTRRHCYQCPRALPSSYNLRVCHLLSASVYSNYERGLKPFELGGMCSGSGRCCLQACQHG